MYRTIFLFIILTTLISCNRNTNNVIPYDKALDIAYNEIIQSTAAGKACTKQLSSLADQTKRGIALQQRFFNKIAIAKYQKSRAEFSKMLEDDMIDTIIENPRLTAKTQANLDCSILCSNDLEISKQCFRVFEHNFQKLKQIVDDRQGFRNFASRPNSIYFKFASDQLTEDASKRLDYVLDELAKVRNITILIYGYTDAVGSAISNVKLAKRRIDTVVAYLLQSSILKENKIKIKKNT